MKDLTDLILAILTVVFTAISTFLIPYIKSKTTAAQYAEIQKWVTIAVEAAEMIYTGTGRGQEKKEYVLAFLNSKGYKLDTESIDNMIEAAVLKLQSEIKGE
jgi:LL-H family phage holin